ncbi:MAG TPA: methionyl-tRNA formyltransferase [Candidatus Onthovivens sp.]|nr:methionyl-tRNA formyltransferase [Candidatus Onthovivens sp.]
MNIREVKILYLGTPEISAFVLKKMIEDNFNIVGVVTQIDKVQGRNNKLVASPVKVVAQEHGIKILQPEKVRDIIEETKDLDPDLILCLAYGQIVPEDFLNIPKYGSLNLHGSLLPAYRGAAPMQYSLLNGDAVTGITLMEMVKKMDAGRMYYKEVVDIDNNDNYDTLTIKMAKAAAKIVIEQLENYVNGKLIGEEQNEELVTFTKKIMLEDEVINFDISAEEVRNKIRALAMTPGAYFVYQNEKYKLFDVDIVEVSGYKSGSIVEYNKNDFIIACAKNAIKIKIIQKPGKRIMNYKDFYNGNRDLFVVKTAIN